jgi:hypothetical protein
LGLSVAAAQNEGPSGLVTFEKAKKKETAERNEIMKNYLTLNMNCAKQQK